MVDSLLPSWWFGATCCCCRSLVATFMMLSLDARCCCDFSLLAVLAILSLGNYAVLALAVCCRSLAVLVLPTVLLLVLLFTCYCSGDDMHYSSFGDACFCCLLSFFYCLGAAYCCCCCCSLIIAVLVMHSLGKLVQFTAAVAVYLLSWRLLGVRFCCWCRSFVLLALSAAGVVVIWNFWFVLCCVDVPIAEAQH
ncbi:hypothetical protein MAM1_0004c00513 [Mucor ambiguus]|uniref:Uncharacterized protein n=1 Tax=Mucor ambiguus TaxID=91626 RepID=A0A0C9MDM1_9FUNG|nr:hypothetical protein MAM1_0004c00513 [Mucor ambiguus]